MYGLTINSHLMAIEIYPQPTVVINVRRMCAIIVFSLKYTGDYPVAILTASGSGLDRQITKQAANMQIHHIAKHNGLSRKTIQSIIDNHTLHQSESDIVNVLAVNLDIKHAMHR
ncbi:potassium-transporting ATPase subunit C [Staphylococcus agnetis]|nr:potassium-transporting ATPase subunit C [Staphylococcus agnetis]